MTVLTKNPRNAIGGPSPTEADDTTVRHAEFDIAKSASYAVLPAQVLPVMGVGDQIEIGVVPAGCKLVPALTHAEIPILDSNGTPLAQYTIGTNTTPAALKAAATAAAALVIKPGDLKTGAGADIGSATVDVPIYATFTVASATPAVVGLFRTNLVLRSFNTDWDTEVL